MRVLFVSGWFPFPPDNGSRIRVYNLIKALSEENEVHLVALLQEDSDPANAARLAEICTVESLHASRWFTGGRLGSLRGLFSNKPRSYIDTFDPAIIQSVREAVDRVRPDVIVGFEISGMTYVPADIGCPVIFEELEIASMLRAVRGRRGLARVRASLMLAKHRAFVKELLSRADAFTCVSPAELDLVKSSCAPGIEGHVIPNGVDTQRFAPRSRAPEPGRLLYNGALTFSANLDAIRYFASKIYPALARRLPDAKLRVTGRTSGVDLTGVADCPGVELVGYVNDIRDELNACVACLVPLREGGGSRLKVLEAMAAGVPIVCTTLGAEGIEAEPGRHLLVADTPDDLAEAVERVTTDDALARGLSTEARKLVEERYSWSIIGRQVSELAKLLVRTSNANRLT